MERKNMSNQSEYIHKYDYHTEKDKWFSNYLKYDDNLNHAETSFISNGFNIKNVETTERLHEANVEFEKWQTEC